MALYTPLPLDEARRLGARYALDVAAVRGIPAGSVNSNYALALASGGRAFLRVYEEQTAASAAGEARLLQHLAARGVATPCPLPLADGSGAFMAEHAGKPVAVFPWIEGEPLCQARVTPAAARLVGEALARVHDAGASFEGAPPSRFGPKDLAERLRGLRDRALEPELAATVARLEARLDGFAARDPGDHNVIHGDLFRDNVLWKDGAVTALLDFESASRGSAAFDLMVTILAWCFGDGLEPDLARALAGGYAAVRPLPEAEVLYAEGSFAALRFTITRITDFELRPPGIGVFKDYRRFRMRAEALDALGPGGVRTLLGA